MAAHDPAMLLPLGKRTLAGISLDSAVPQSPGAAWLWGIILNLLLVPGFYDVALRDFGLSFGALALARLATGLGKD